MPKTISTATIVLLGASLVGCSTRLPTIPAMPRPQELRVCADGPFGWELCPTLKLRWPSEERRLERERREIQKEREERRRRILEEREEHAARAVV